MPIRIECDGSRRGLILARARIGADLSRAFARFFFCCSWVIVVGACEGPPASRPELGGSTSFSFGESSFRPEPEGVRISEEPWDVSAIPPDAEAETEAIVRCNGREDLCDRSYRDVAYLTTHNAWNNAAENWFVPSQNDNLVSQLEHGVRAFMLDTYWYDDLLGQRGVFLCHGACAPNVPYAVYPEGAVHLNRPFAGVLMEIRDWMDAHPRNVVTLILENYARAEDLTDAFLEGGLLNADGTSGYLHIQSSPETPWPSLGEMIDSGKRLVVLTDEEGVDESWLHQLWQHAWETRFTYRLASEFSVDDNYSCDRNRGQQDNQLFILNHFLTMPTALEIHADQVNPMLGERAAACRVQSGQFPNFITVDFYASPTRGLVRSVITELNDGFDSQNQ